ncbi:copper resistance protein CopD [Serratia sp. S1B]|nr:copper resistance protein CopD [Serratia sp. S1B]
MTLATWFVLCRFLHFAAVMLMFGFGLFNIFLSPLRISPQVNRDFYPLQRVAVWISAFTAVLMLALQAGLMGDGWGDTWQLTIWWAVLGTTFGKAWCWQLLFSLLAVLALLLAGAKRQAALLLCAVLLLINLAFVGHAVMHSGALGILQRINHAVHLLAVGYWFGCVIPMLICLRYLPQPQWHKDVVTALIRFSRWGHGAVMLVIITGVSNSLLILGHWPREMNSAYQSLLLLKITLVALMILVALVNRYAIVPAMRTRPTLAQRGLVAGCWLQLILGASVLWLVSLLATSSPI